MKPSSEEIFKWAREVYGEDTGKPWHASAFKHIEALCDLAYAAGAAAMKERAAKVCEGENDNSTQDFDPEILLWNTAIRLCAMKIRELGGDDETNN